MPSKLSKRHALYIHIYIYIYIYIYIICPPMFPIVLPHFRLYGVVSLHMCVLPYKYPYAQGCDLSWTYSNDTSHYCRFMIGHCLGRMVKYWKCCPSWWSCAKQWVGAGESDSWAQPHFLLLCHTPKPVTYDTNTMPLWPYLDAIRPSLWPINEPTVICLFIWIPCAHGCDLSMNLQ